jgi:hypothetical protein
MGRGIEITLTKEQTGLTRWTGWGKQNQASPVLPSLPNLDNPVNPVYFFSIVVLLGYLSLYSRARFWTF